MNAPTQSTADQVLAHPAIKAAGLKLVDRATGQYKGHSPLRPNSGSNGFSLKIDGPEHGRWHDHVTEEKGSLYELAQRLNIALPQQRRADSDSASYSKPPENLAEYAAEHGVPESVFIDAEWSNSTWAKQPALCFTTANGPRYRLLSGKTKYIQNKGYTPCLYGLERAVQLASGSGLPLVMCNGEASVVVAQHYGLPAFCQTMGEGKELAESSLSKLRAAWPNGPIMIAPDCDSTGRKMGREYTERLQAALYQHVQAVDLGLDKGNDLADFCRLHKETSAADLMALPSLSTDGEEEQQAALPQPAVMSAADLAAKEFAPIRWAVPDLIPEGVTLLVGAPKIGKSWLCFDLALSIALGGYVLGKIKVEQGDVLYMALEDSPRRLQDRMLKLLRGNAAPRNLHIMPNDPNMLRLHDGGLAWIESWIQQHPSARMLIIDTLARVKPPQKANGNQYEQDYNALSGLLRLAGEHGIAVVLVHHARKAAAEDALETVSGTFGLTGGVDGVMIVKRDRLTNEAVLTVTGRDVEEQALALNWDAQLTRWTLVGPAAQFKLSRERKDVIQVLDNNPNGLAPKDIATILSKASGATRFLLADMFKQGQITKNELGLYITNTTNSTNSTNTANTTNTPEYEQVLGVLVQDTEATNTDIEHCKAPKVPPVSGVSGVCNDAQNALPLAHEEGNAPAPQAAPDARSAIGRLKVCKAERLRNEGAK